MHAKRTKIALLSLLVLGVSLGHASTAEAKRRIAIKFQKAFVGGNEWNGDGVASDGTEVEVVAFLDETRVAGELTHVLAFRFIFSADGKTATVALTGTINNKNGKIVLNGAVDSSTFSKVPAGSPAQLRAQVIDAVFTVEGVLKLTVPK